MKRFHCLGEAERCTEFVSCRAGALVKLQGDHRFIHGSIECTGKFKQSLNFIEHAFKQRQAKISVTYGL